MKSRTLDAVGVGLAFAVVFLTIGVIWTRGIEAVIQGFTHDDSFYYLETARRAAAGEGFTFDGRNMTNGFHPLWMLIVTGLYRVVGASRETMLRVVLTAQAVLLLLPTLLLCRALGARLLGSLGGLASLGLGIALFTNRQVNGMESGVLVLLSLVVAWGVIVLDWTSPAAPLRRRLIFGLSLGAVFLARTDSVFLLVAAGLAAMVRYFAEMPGPPLARLGRLPGTSRRSWSPSSWSRRRTWHGISRLSAT